MNTAVTSVRALSLSSVCKAAWPEDTRRSNLSRKMPRSRLRSRSRKATTRRRQQRLRWCTRVVSAGRRCRIRKRSSSTLRANIPKILFLRSWWVWKPERRSPNLRCGFTVKDC